jgi:hypothetical protein
MAESLLAHLYGFPQLPEIPLQGVLRTFLYHAQKEINEFFEGHFPLPGEVLRPLARPAPKLKAVYKIFDRLKGGAPCEMVFFPFYLPSRSYFTAPRFLCKALALTC